MHNINEGHAYSYKLQPVHSRSHADPIASGPCSGAPGTYIRQTQPTVACEGRLCLTIGITFKDAAQSPGVYMAYTQYIPGVIIIIIRMYRSTSFTE